MFEEGIGARARPRRVESVPVRPLRGPLGDLLQPVAPAVIALHGRRGSGKTTVALGALQRPYVATAEMAPELVLAYLRRLGMRHAGIVEPVLDRDQVPARLLLGASAEAATELVLDSATETGDELAAVVACKDWARRVSGVAIVIFQHTKDGQPRGSSQALHACDAEILVEAVDGEHVLDVQKNRFGATGSASFVLGGAGATRPRRDRYYSVEGSAGSYRLVPWPPTRAVACADVLRWQEEQLGREDGAPMSLPAPPAAVAAGRSRLAPRGWIEPADWRARAAYARAQGVPYWSPVETLEDEHG